MILLQILYNNHIHQCINQSTSSFKWYTLQLYRIAGRQSCRDFEVKLHCNRHYVVQLKTRNRIERDANINADVKLILEQFR